MSATVLIGQAPTNLGPLTTTFTPPAACTATVGAGGGGLGGLLGIGDKDKAVAWLGQACSRGKPVDATSCWPETSKGAAATEAPLHGWGFYSPGLHCPVGYATACSATGGSGGSGWPVQFKLRDGETAVGCCPSGYGCANINGQTCTMVATSTTIPTVTCDGGKTGDVATQTVPDAKASITAFSLFAAMIQINWQSSDRPESTTNGSPTATTNRLKASGTQTVDTDATSIPEILILDGNPQTTAAASIDFPSQSTTPSLQEDRSSSENSGGFTSGAKVAIGVAGAVAVIMMVVCALFYYWRRRKARREEQELDRLYGVKGTMSSGGDFTTSQDIPGWYRGQRLATPVKDPFAHHHGSDGGGLREMEFPPVPHYRLYRA